MIKENKIDKKEMIGMQLKPAIKQFISTSIVFYIINVIINYFFDGEITFLKIGTIISAIAFGFFWNFETFIGNSKHHRKFNEFN